MSETSMSYHEAKVRIKGVVPLMMHNGRLVDPLNEFVVEMKKITSKSSKKRTDEDHKALCKLEWFGGIYVDDRDQPCIPGQNIEAAIKEAARSVRKGKDVERAVIVEGDWPLTYKGPKDLEKLFAHGGFNDRRRAVVERKGIMRTRPIFRTWELAFTVMYRQDLINKRDLESWLVHGGRITGLGDHRPRFGRYEVTEFKSN